MKTKITTLELIAVIALFGTGVSYAEGTAFNSLAGSVSPSVLSEMALPENIPSPEASPAGDVSVEQLKTVPGATPEEKLKNLFEEGVPAAKEDLIGWHSGRSFSDTGEPEARLLIAWESTGLKALKIDTINTTETKDNPAFYEDMTINKISDVKRYIKTFHSERDLRSVTNFPGAVQVRSLKHGTLQIEWRKARGYIIERSTRNEEATRMVGWKAETVKLPAVAGYRYYFEDVTPKE